MHVQSANTLNKGTLDVRTNLIFFTKVGDYLGQNKPANFNAVNYWDVQSNVMVSYGFMDHFDVTLMNRIYQDNHKPSEYNAPEDIFLDMKLGSYGVNNNRFGLGLLGQLRIPTGQEYNYPFEPYTAGAVEYGLTGLFSFFNDPYLPDRSFGLHLNLGWYYHNDAGKVIYTDNKTGTEYKADGNASELQYGLGFDYPTELFNLNLELWGISFINQPDKLAYSRENFTYVTPSVRFKPRPWFSFDLGLDVRVSSDKETSADGILPAWVSNLELPNYPSWKVYLGANFTILPTEGPTTQPGRDSDVRSRVDFFENLLRERQKTRNIEDELRRLKKEREQAEKELEELRQMLEEQDK
ncbi:MAG: hypothetical protein WAN36_12010 [Calditrichia bacterium]